MWFTETPWPPILFCAALAVVLIAGWSADRRASYLLGVLCLVVASGVIYAVERYIVTDAEQIEESVYGIASAFQQHKLDETLEFISPRAPQIKELVTLGMKMVDVDDDLRIRDLHVTMKSENSRGIAHFRANATISATGQGSLGRHSSRWELTWQREADQWKVIRVRRLHWQTGQEIPNPLASTE